MLYDNSPTRKYIRWTDTSVDFNNVLYYIQDGYTDMTYVYWNENNPNVFSYSDNLPSKDSGKHIVFINEDGKGVLYPDSPVVNYEKRMISSTKDITDKNQEDIKNTSSDLSLHISNDDIHMKDEYIEKINGFENRININTGNINGLKVDIKEHTGDSSIHINSTYKTLINNSFQDVSFADNGLTFISNTGQKVISKNDIRGQFEKDFTVSLSNTWYRVGILKKPFARCDLIIKLNDSDEGVYSKFKVAQYNLNKDNINNVILDKEWSIYMNNPFISEIRISDNVATINNEVYIDVKTATTVSSRKSFNIGVYNCENVVLYDSPQFQAPTTDIYVTKTIK